MLRSVWCPERGRGEGRGLLARYKISEILPFKITFRMSSDPLSFFAGDCSSSSESEDDGEAKGSGAVCDGSEIAGTSDGDKLPSPETLFATVNRPSFLKEPNPSNVNWDRFVKKNRDDYENVHAVEGAAGQYAAIAPPEEDDSSKHNKAVHSSLSAAIVRTYSNTDGEISAPPVRYTAKEMEAKFKTVSDSLGVDVDGAGSKGATKRGAELEVAPEEQELKKQKVENFRQKEKRKRALGQASRGTSYVEEEKRVLRQHFATDMVMN